MTTWFVGLLFMSFVGGLYLIHKKQTIKLPQKKKRKTMLVPLNMHIAKEGETFASIAVQCGMTENELRNLNPHVKEEVTEGDELSITLSRTFAVSQDAGIHILQGGQKMEEVAALYHVSVEELEALNPTVIVDHVGWPGAALVLPRHARRHSVQSSRNGNKNVRAFYGSQEAYTFDSHCANHEITRARGIFRRVRQKFKR